MAVIEWTPVRVHPEADYRAGLLKRAREFMLRERSRWPEDPNAPQPTEKEMIIGSGANIMTEVQIRSGEEHWPDYNASVRWQAYNYHLEFKVRAATRQPDNSMIYYCGDGDVVTEFDQGDAFIEGSIKWDGCSNIRFGDGEGDVHLCGADALAELAAVLLAVMKIASVEIPHFDKHVAHFTEPV